MEIWKDIVGYEGIYQVSNTGKVKRLGVYSNQNATWKSEEKILKAGNNGNGYLFVNLSKNNKQKQMYVHRLVADAFIENPQNKKTVNHIDSDRTNNNADNLEWATYEENNNHMLRHLKDIGVSKKNNKFSQPVLQYDLDMNFIKEYPSMREATRQTGVKSIYVACKGIKQKTAGGYIWKYK